MNVSEAYYLSKNRLRSAIKCLFTYKYDRKELKRLSGRMFCMRNAKNTIIPDPRFYAVHRFYFERADFHLTKHRILYCLLERVNIKK